MDAWEWNKLAAGVLAVAIFLLAVHFAAEAIFTVPSLSKPAYIAVAPQKPAPPENSPQE
jgi:hypothetical protein